MPGERNQQNDRIIVLLQSLTRWWVGLLVLVLVLVSLGVIEPATAEGPWKGQVVDKETGKPLEGVVVLAAWYKAYSTHGGWGGAGYYDSEETVTDINGHFTIQSKQTWTKSVQHRQRTRILHIQVRL